MLCSLRLALFVLGFILLSSADGLVRRARAAIATAGGEAGGEAARPNPAFGRQPLPPGPFVGSIADDSPHRNFPYDAFSTTFKCDKGPCPGSKQALNAAQPAAGGEAAQAPRFAALANGAGSGAKPKPDVTFAYPVRSLSLEARCERVCPAVNTHLSRCTICACADLSPLLPLFSTLLCFDLSLSLSLTHTHTHTHTFFRRLGHRRALLTSSPAWARRRDRTRPKTPTKTATKRLFESIDRREKVKRVGPYRESETFTN